MTFKKAICLILSAVFTLSAFAAGAGLAADIADARSFAAPFAATHSGGSLGDANGDGATNSRDVIAVMKHIVGAGVKSFSETLADCNGDGKINSKDVTTLMKAIASGTPLGSLAGDEETVCSERDAYVLVETDDYGNSDDGIAPGWRFDARGSAARNALDGDYGVLRDVSTEAGCALIYGFNKTTAGRLELSTSVAARGDGFSLEYRNAGGECVYRLYTDGSWRVALPGGDSAALTESVDGDFSPGVSVIVDLGAGIAQT